MRALALLWSLFALGLIVVAALSPEALANAVFLQVTLASACAAVGAIAAARYICWGVALGAAGQAGVLVAWIAGDSGESYRLPVAVALAVFLLACALDRRAFVRPSGR
ncbi:hypothetical protein P8Q88_09200 [Qipengyuania sp. XHP0207]|uniref:hypothetical protein n=1 Tax=Qipengyuania sp. XHP0207 TaxID=3038078 RepID=UPI00241F98D1|nr:hypothetical protein [Qipengyuania sp. XHP0207]MDG5748359.1 hypothetical protein [Qipengyuania sp. XHP0207]